MGLFKCPVCRQDDDLHWEGHCPTPEPKEKPSTAQRDPYADYDYWIPPTKTEGGDNGKT